MSIISLKDQLLWRRHSFIPKLSLLKSLLKFPLLELLGTYSLFFRMSSSLWRWSYLSFGKTWRDILCLEIYGNFSQKAGRAGRGWEMAFASKAGWTQNHEIGFLLYLVHWPWGQFFMMSFKVLWTMATSQEWINSKLTTFKWHDSLVWTGPVC